MYRLIFLFSTFCWAQTSVVSTADSLFLMGNYNKAIELYKQDSLSIYNQKQIAKSYVSQTAYKKAIPYYEKVVYKDTTQLLATYELAKLYYKTKQIPRAINYFEWLQNKETKNPNYSYYIGLSLELLKQPGFIKQFEEAVTLDEAHLKSLKKLTKYYLKKADWGKFNKYILLGLKYYPENTILINYQAQSCFQQQQYAKAVTFFEKIIKVDPNNKFIVSKLGQSYHALKKYNKALPLYKKALKLDRENGNFHTQLALLYQDKEEYTKAYIHYYMALKYNETKLDNEHYNLGILFKKQKKYKEAIESFQQAIKENMHNRKAHFELAVCADNFYADDKEKLRLYKVYLLSFKGKNKSLDAIAEARMSYYKEKIHLSEPRKETENK